jgi:hypothetical protein
MSTGEQANILVEGEEIWTVTSYKFLGALITNDSYIHDEIKRRISLGNATMAKLTKIMKDSGVSHNTKVKLVQTIVFPAMLYGCESWTLRKADKRKLRGRCIQAMDMEKTAQNTMDSKKDKYICD